VSHQNNKINQSNRSEATNNGGDSKMHEFPDGRSRGRSLPTRIAVDTRGGGRRLEGIKKSFRPAADPIVDICKGHDRGFG
jgi:hypothetical protein